MALFLDSAKEATAPASEVALAKYANKLYGRYIGERQCCASSPNMKSRITPMLSNLSILTDCLFRVKFGTYWVAIVTIEKHSLSSSNIVTSYRNTLCSNVEDMFPVLRLHNPELEKVYGFCFPKWGINSAGRWGVL